MAEKELQKEKVFRKKDTVVISKSDEIIDASQIEEESPEVYSAKIDLIQKQLLSELTPIEKDVLSVAREMLKKKRLPTEIKTERIETISPMVDSIYAKSIARFLNQKNYKKEAIFLAIKSLEQKRWIITGQRSTKEEILNNPIKKKILAFVEKYPGVHARDTKIALQLDMTRNPFIKHMVSLEAFNLVRSSKIGSTLNYFPVDLPDVFDDLAVQFHNPIVVEIIKLFLADERRKDGRMTLMQMAKELGVYHRAIQYHINFLLKNNVLLSVSPTEIKQNEKVDTRRKYYRVNQDLLLRYNRLFKIPPFSEWL